MCSASIESDRRTARLDVGLTGEAVTLALPVFKLYPLVPHVCSTRLPLLSDFYCSLLHSFKEQPVIPSHFHLNSTCE